MVGSIVESPSLDSDALLVAAWEGDKDRVRLLLERGADVNFQDKNGHSPLHLALLSNHSNNVDILIDFGADLNARDGSGRTTLTIAVERQMVNETKYLLSNVATTAERLSMLQS